MDTQFCALKYSDADIRRAFDTFGKNAPKVLARVLNRAATSTRTVMQRTIAADTKLKVGIVRDQMRIEKATATEKGLRARIIITGKRIPLQEFSAKPTRRGVTANTGAGRKLYPGTFLAQMKSKHQGVFQRRGKARLPIDEKFGPSLPHVFGKHMPDGLAAGEDSLRKNLSHELTRSAWRDVGSGIQVSD